MARVRLGFMLVLTTTFASALTSCTVQTGLGPSHWGAPMRSPAPTTPSTNITPATSTK